MTDNQESSDEPVGHTPHDSNPQMTVSVDFDAATPPGAGGQEVAYVSLQDASHPGIRASLQYLVPEQLGKIEPVGFSVTHLVADRPEGAARFGPGVIKDLPLARWDRVAQAAVRQAVMERSLAQVSITLEPGEYERLTDGLYNGPDEVIATPLHVPQNRRHRAIEMVHRVRPDLDPDESRGAARSWNGLVKLAEALDEYMEILASGSNDPAGEMAERHGVAQATVRTWVHRARQAGLTSSFTGWVPKGTQSSSSEPGASAPDDEAFRAIGEVLQKARLAAGLTVEDLSKATRIRVAIIRAIENGNFAVCGGDVYARGHIRVFAKAVDLDPGGLLQQYDSARFGVEPPPESPPQMPESPRKPRRKRGK